MNKVEFTNALIAKSGDNIVSRGDVVNKKAANRLVNDFFDIISETLQSGESVQIVGFGTFEPCERAARKGVNPNTREKIDIAACKSVRFRVGKNLKDAVNA